MLSSKSFESISEDKTDESWEEHVVKFAKHSFKSLHTKLLSFNKLLYVKI